MGAVVGIDLGTTNTVVAAARDGHPVALPDESGSTLIPSIVSFLPSGAVLVGSAARERRSADARNTIYSIKRLIGRTWGTPEINEAVARFPFELREGPGRATFVIARGETYTLPEISAFVLRKAKSIAELELGESVDRAVITVPANFNDLQRAATKVAGRVAGLEVLRVLNEPTAAALAFGHARGNRECIAVYDFGGGTFDLTVLRLTDDVFEVLATAGDTYLGGDDIDSAIVQKIARHLGPTVDANPRTSPDTYERLRSAAEQLKHDLSNASDARVRMRDYEIAESTGPEFVMTRSELDALVGPIVNRTFTVCRDALGMAKVTPKDINHVLLVGGTTRDPLVKQRVEEFFGRSVRADLDPHEVVALGAAQQAMALTQLRATASGVPVAPPPRVAVQSSVTDVEDSKQPSTEPFGLPRKRTDSGVGDRDTLPPGRVSVPPPEEPMSHPAPTTQTLGSRERRTTGLGLGPSAEPETSAARLDPTREASDGAVPKPKQPLIVAPATRSLDPVQTRGKPSAGAPAAPPVRDDTDMPAVVRRDVTREPAVRVTRGNAPLPDTSAIITSAVVRPSPLATTTASAPLPDTSATITSAVVRPDATAASTTFATKKTPLMGRHDRALSKDQPKPLAAASPTAGAKSARETIPDAVEPWDEPEPALPKALDDDLPVVAQKLRPPFERAVLTQVSVEADQSQVARAATPLTSDEIVAVLPLVVGSRPDNAALRPSGVSTGEPAARAHPPAPRSPQRRTLDEPAEARLDLPAPNAPSHTPDGNEHADDEIGENEPTVIRRSRRDAPGLGNAPATNAGQPERKSPERTTRESPPETREPFELPIVATPQVGSTSSLAEPRAQNPAKLNEAEIRARYGNLPLIVGGRRVGAREAQAQIPSLLDADSRTAQAVAGKPATVTPPELDLSVSSPGAPPPRLEAPLESLTHTPEAQGTAAAGVVTHAKPGPMLGPSTSEDATVTKRLQPPPLTEKSTPFGRHLQPLPIYSIDPHAIEPELLEPELLEPLASEPTHPRISLEPTAPGPTSLDDALQKSHRPHSSRPAARQHIDELELPVPDLPPRQPGVSATPITKQGGPSQDRFGIARGQPDRTAGNARGLDLTRGPVSRPLDDALALGATATSPSTRQVPLAVHSTTEPIVLPGVAPPAVDIPPLLASLPKSTSLRPALLIDVTPLSLCVETVGGYVDVLVNRNTPVPCERTRDFVTAQDNQQTVIVRVAQGESKLFLENVLLGEVQLTGIPAGPRGQSRIAVTFGIDSDGILHVRALDVASGLSALADLRLTGTPTPPEIAQMTARQLSKGHA